MRETPIPDYITLVGDEEENFYQLGLNDRGQYLPVFDHIEAFIGLKSPILTKMISRATAFITTGNLIKYPQMEKLLNAYSEGLELAPTELLRNLLIPDLFSSIGKWLPSSGPLFGCSSVFTSNLHGRVLDFPLLGSYDKAQRIVHYKLKNAPQILGLSTAGFPYPSLTSMSSNGVSFAIHQKFSTVFNPSGIPIWHLVYEVLKNCDDIESTLAYLKQYKTITKWGLNFSFKDGRSLLVDMEGDHIDYQINEKTNDYHYTNNIPLSENTLSHSFPSNIKNYCLDREHQFEEKWKKSKLEQNTEQKIFKALSSQSKQSRKKTANLSIDTLTLTSLTCVVMNAKKGELSYLLGQAPKRYPNDILNIKNIWHKPQKTIIKNKPSMDHFTHGFQHFAYAQAALDQKKGHDVFHHLQMSIDYLKDHPLSTIVEFYLLVVKYLEFNHIHDRELLLKEFRALEELPPILQENKRLFIYRLEKVLKRKPEKLKDLKEPILKAVHNIDSKLPSLALTHLRKLIVPRFELWDILYLYK